MTSTASCPLTLDHAYWILDWLLMIEATSNSSLLKVTSLMLQQKSTLVQAEKISFYRALFTA